MRPPAANASHEARLRAIAERLVEYSTRYELAKNSRCVFTHAYALMTRRIAEGIRRGDIVDPDWIIALAEAFASRYFAALEAWDNRVELPPPWRAVFDAICTKRSSVLEDLVLAMTAHIVHDLPLALRDVSLEEPQASHIHDFHAINDVLGNSIDEIQDTITRRHGYYVGWLDHIGIGYDEILTNYGVRVARGLAWYNASRLLGPRSAEDGKRAIERSPRIVVESVMDPPIWSVRVVLRATRWFLGFFRQWPACSEALTVGRTR